MGAERPCARGGVKFLKAVERGSREEDGRKEGGRLSSVVSGSVKIGRVAARKLADSTVNDNRWYSTDVNTLTC